MGLRLRKEQLTVLLSGYVRAGYLTEEQEETYRLMYARSRTTEEQDQVTSAIKFAMDSWKTENDRFSRVVRTTLDLGDDDEDPPALKAALERARVRFST